MGDGVPELENASGKQVQEDHQGEAILLGAPPSSRTIPPKQARSSAAVIRGARSFVLKITWARRFV
jgi:hypothetical protein